MQRDAIDFGTVNIPSLFGKYFVTTLLGMVSMSAVTAIDGIFIGHGVGSDGIAAVNICVPVWMIFTGLGLMAGAGSSVVASIHLARGKIKAARLNVTQAILFVTIIAALVACLIMAFPEATARMLGSSEHLMPKVLDYLLWIVPALPFQMWLSVSLFIIRLDGAPQYAMWCSVVTAIINTVLDWVFIFPLGMGVRGAAIATGISIVAGGCMGIGYLMLRARTVRMIRLKFSRKSMSLSLRNIGYQCKIGSPALLGEATIAVLMFMGNQVFMQYLGDDGVGAFGIACYYTPFVFMFGNAVAQSAQPIISFNYGAGKMDRVSSASRLAIITAIVCGTIGMAVFMLFPGPLVGLFIGQEGNAARIAIEGLPLFALGYIFYVTNVASIGLLQSLERMKPLPQQSSPSTISYATGGARQPCLPSTDRPMKNTILIITGTLSLGLGITGMFLPVLPTTPFLLLTAWCWMKCSPRLHAWLMSHPRLGPYIRDFQEHKAIPVRVKAVSVTTLWLTIGLSIVLVHPLWLRILLAAIAIGVTIHILSFKTKKLR